MSELMLDVGQANELKLALRRANYTNDDIKRLCEGSILADVRNVLYGDAEVKLFGHIIDCDAEPFAPEGSKVHPEDQLPGKMQGSLIWDPSAVRFYLSNFQRNGKRLIGDKLHDELVGKAVLPANILDYLLAHQRLIPEQWERDERGCPRWIFFWGTIYCDAHGLFVRCLVFLQGIWQWHYHRLDNHFDVGDPAAIWVN